VKTLVGKITGAAAGLPTPIVRGSGDAPPEKAAPLLAAE
jgi:hypothetical protein